MLRLFSAFLVFLFLLASMLPASLAHEVAAPKGPIILTITGNIHHHNRDGVDAFKDAFFKHHNREFERGYGFDRSMLLELQQHRIKAYAEGWQNPADFVGPRLEDVLSRAGAMGRTFRFMALDGYAAEISLEELDAHKWILAHKADGKPLGLGGRGPLWLVYDTGGRKITAKQEGKWVWSVFLIEVE